MPRKRPNVIINVINLALLLLIIMGFGTGILITAVQLALNRGVTFSRPHPTPLPLSLAYLPLPEAAITTGPAVTLDWDNEDNDRGDYFIRELNSEVEIYSNRFGLQWSDDEHFRLIVTVGDRRLGSPSYLNQGGDIQELRWSYRVLFPWPQEPFTGQQVYAIDGTIRQGSPDLLDIDAQGPAGAVFEELDPDPQTLSDGPLASCRYQVHGHVTLTSYSPVIGNFQFACQFDATEYALVSGWFWE